MIRHRMNAAGEIGAYWHRSHHIRRLSNMMKLVCLAIAVLAGLFV